MLRLLGFVVEARRRREGPRSGWHVEGWQMRWHLSARVQFCLARVLRLLLVVVVGEGASVALYVFW